MIETTILRQIAQLFDGYRKTGRQDLARAITRIIRACIPFDGARLHWINSKRDRLVFVTVYQHTNEKGEPTLRTHHTIVIRPSLADGYTIRITGRNYDFVKDEIETCMRKSLDAPTSTYVDRDPL